MDRIMIITTITIVVTTIIIIIVIIIIIIIINHYYDCRMLCATMAVVTNAVNAANLHHCRRYHQVTCHCQHPYITRITVVISVAVVKSACAHS